MPGIYPPLFVGTIANGATQYIGVPFDPQKGIIGLQIAWKDATSSATITLELTSFAHDEAPTSEAGAAWEWRDSGQTITGPAASAAGSSLVNLENVRQKRARLKVVAAATTVLEVMNGLS